MPNTVVSEIRKPLAVTSGEGFFFLCPRCVLDIEPQCFFDDGCTPWHPPLFLNLIDCIQQISGNIRCQRYTTGRNLPRPMGGYIFAGFVSISLHA